MARGAIFEADCPEAVRRWFDDLFTRGDLGAVDGIVAPDFEAHGPADLRSPSGREDFRGFLGWYTRTFTEREWAIHDVICAGDKVVVRYTGWTSYEGGFFDIPASGQRVKEGGITIFRLQDGLVHEIWSELSDLDLVLQLGARPALPE